MDKLTRRNFIFGLSKFGIVSWESSIAILIKLSWVEFQKLLAQTSGTSLNTLDSITLGTSRWMFDGVLDQGSENPCGNEA